MIFLSNIIKTLKNHTDSIIENVRDPTLKAILKYRKHMPTKIIKENSDIFSNFTYQSFNNMINICIFPTSLELANITPVYKKCSKNSKENYRPVSILPNISKIHERCFLKPISNTFENIFSKFLCGFKQGLSA